MYLFIVRLWGILCDAGIKLVRIDGVFFSMFGCRGGFWSFNFICGGNRGCGFR